MTTIALQKYLVSKINSIGDDVFLNQLKVLVEKQENIYQLSDFQVEKISNSREQVKKGVFISEVEMNNKVEEWLQEK